MHNVGRYGVRGYGARDGGKLGSAVGGKIQNRIKKRSLKS